MHREMIVLHDVGGSNVKRSWQARDRTVMTQLRLAMANTIRVLYDTPNVRTIMGLIMLEVLPSNPQILLIKPSIHSPSQLSSPTTCCRASQSMRKRQIKLMLQAVRE